MINLLIFDLDGTLADTISDITDAVNYAVKPYGVGPISVNATRSMVGSGITKLIEGLIPAENIITRSEKDEQEVEHAKDRAVKRFIEYYSEHLLDNTLPYSGVKETLTSLAHYKKAVISNKRETLSRDVLEGVGLLGFFDIVLGSDSVPERKPSPVPVLEVLKRCGMSRENAVMIGDSNFDIEAGKRAGVKTVAVTYGYRSKKVLKDADFMIDSFSELLDVLQKIEKDK
jgi:phosphoglycolate phosphatase